MVFDKSYTITFTLPLRLTFRTMVCLCVKGLPRQATDTDGRLHIPQVSVQDSGQYVCTALDAAAGAEPAIVTLIVDDSCTR